MTGGYLALVGTRTEVVRRISTRARDSGLDLHMPLPGGMLFAHGAAPLVDLDGQGVIVGAIFHRHGPLVPLARLDADDLRSIVASRGDALGRFYWGGYVALVRSDGGLRLLRDPSGAMPCYCVQLARGFAVTSDARLLAAFGLVRPRIDVDALALHLYRAALPTRRTALAAITELRPGFARDPDGEERPFWSPVEHLGESDAEERPVAEMLGRKIHAAVAALTQGRRKILVSLSGGLDSSIVAASLAEAGRDIVCLTMFTADAHGDERAYARALAAHIGAPLIERPYRIEDVDILAPLNAHLPRPTGRSQALAYERTHLAIAAELGADAFATGNGGDNVFAHSQTAAAIADRYLAHGLGGLWRVVIDTCRQTGCSVAAASRAALHILRSGTAGYRWRPNDALLTPDAIARGAGEGFDHPWLDDVRSALPGKTAHVAALLRVQPSLEPMRGRFAPVIHPLLAQPVVEAALAIPSWLWRTGGIDRAMARRAFAAHLPGSIVHRRSKGGPDGFSRALIAANQTAIHERLAEGQLAAHGIVDRAALSSAFDEDGVPHGNLHVRIQELLVAEAWIDHWQGVRSPG